MRSALNRKSSVRDGLVLAIICLLCPCYALSQPGNDNCANAFSINIPSAGFATGVFSSATVDISLATIQPTETFAPAIFVAGQHQKSVWYRFTLPTTRSVRVTLAQPGSSIAAGDVGFAVYKANACLPAVADISTKLTPLGVFGNTFHPCVEAGDYLIQVSGKSTANGPVYVTIETAFTSAAYDRPAQAHDFGILNQGVKTTYYDVDCQSIEDATEICPALDAQQYNKSTWHVFTTPAYFDYIAFFLVNKTHVGNVTFGYKLYRGDVRTTPFSSLPVIGTCDSLTADFFAASRFYKCGDLDPNNVYSIQVFFHANFTDNIQVTMASTGTNATHAPEPILSAIPPSNALGTLAPGSVTNATDYLACNSRHSHHPCAPSLPAAGIPYNGINYNLSTFYTFTLSSTSTVVITSGNSCGGLLGRLYKQGVSNSCNTLDTANIVSEFLISSLNLNCLDPGNYTLQVSGTDSILPTFIYTTYYGYFTNTANPICGLTNLGNQLSLRIDVVNTNLINKYSLNMAGAFDSLNAAGGIMQPLVNGTTYSSQTDTFACSNTVLPADTTCAPDNSKAMYREFVVADSGVVNILWDGTLLWHRLYKGDANALAIAQNAYVYPARITGLIPYTACFQHGYCYETKACVTPGTYTIVTFGNDGDIARPQQQQTRFDIVNTTHHSPATAEDMGDILSLLPATGGNVQSAVDYFSCRDNAVAINGFQPCTINGVTATKAIYRQFYLSAPALVSISYNIGFCNSSTGTLFYGKATDGIAGLTPVGNQWSCFTSGQSTNGCTLLAAGWYTVVSYGKGSTYENQAQTIDIFDQRNNNTDIGRGDQITIHITPSCQGPAYNRPYKAAVDPVSNQPFLIQWANRTGSTAAYPRTDTTYTLPAEHFNCTVDTPFSAHPITACAGDVNKVVYYVFRTTQESYVQINSFDHFAAVYDRDVRLDSALFPSLTPIQSCLKSYGSIQLCKLLPGTYTLVIFGTNADNCATLSPTIYIDKVDYSRFDHANNAYDFGIVPGDSSYYYGKVGDVNPLHNGRAPSNDFFYCTTGSRPMDPDESNCGFFYNANIYKPGYNIQLYDSTNPFNYQIPRRNLWYTFVTDKPGQVSVKVTNKTHGKQFQYRFSVYKSNVNGTLPFSTVVSTGQVDSTLAQGLTYIASNPFAICFGGDSVVSFYRDPCASIPERYYIIVDNVNSWPVELGMNPNSQVEVAVMLDSVTVNSPGDHCSDAVIAPLNGAGSNVSTVSVDCHTIGTDYGEFNPTLTCPAGSPTAGYKTSWFKITITGTDTLDVTTYLSENTNALPSDIKYRLMNGDCSAMQERSCVQDAQTQDTYKCLAPGSYYVQVFIPVTKNGQPVTGTVSLHLAGVLHTDTCAPVNNCLSNANFTPQFNCDSSDLVSFINFSTYGSSITYSWDFGYAGQTSNAVSPQFQYPALATDQTYTVTLTVHNSGCGGQSVTTRPVTVPARPGIVNLGNDTALCNGGSVVLNAASHPGASYNWQDGSANAAFTVTATGRNDYYVTVTYNGCSRSDTITVYINPISPLRQDVLLCNSTTVQLNSLRGYGETYNWSTGATTPSIDVAMQGIYWNDVTLDVCTIRDSFIVSGAIYPLGNDKSACLNQPYVLNATTPGALSYVWQDGTPGPIFNVITPGLYWVDIFFGNCSIRDSIIISAIQPLQHNLNATICSGQTYTLPSGTIVSTPGIYTDTLRSTLGCDSLINNISLTVQSAVSITTNAVICAGQTYTLPWGTTVNSPGIYRDTLRYATTNCDSLRTTVNLSVQTAVSTIINAAICAGQSYTLPSGIVINTAGTYMDTLRSMGGCDSIRFTVNLSTLTAVTQIFNPSICQGQTYTLPWGAIVNTPGTYRDTLRSAFGCDSIRRVVDLVVQASLSITTSAAICSGQTYTLPWGTIVNSPGIYRDTLRYAITNCDSLRQTVELSVQVPASVITNAVICQGSSYTLPWGVVVTSGGTYSDTLRSTLGCDSLRRTVNLTVQTAATVLTNAVICQGQTYTLPWGAVVNTPGTYRDTLRSTFGCDSIRRVVNLTVQTVAAEVINPVICAGGSYTLPWGIVVTAAGTYRDTVHYSTGCDSLIRTVNLQVRSAATVTISPVICSGETYTLPWGMVVNASGIYRDTVRTAIGCDSLIRTVFLTVNPKPQLLLSKSNDITCNMAFSQLNASGADRYEWTPANTLNNAFISNPVASPITTTMYYVRGRSLNGCTAEDSIEVSVSTVGVNEGYKLPNAFTPNNDRKNECFGIKAWGHVSELKFFIYNRWGQLVFSTTDPSRCWDGTFNGVPQPSGGFVYVISAKTNCGHVTRKGIVLLIR